MNNPDVCELEHTVAVVVFICAGVLSFNSISHTFSRFMPAAMIIFVRGREIWSSTNIFVFVLTCVKRTYHSCPLEILLLCVDMPVFIRKALSFHLYLWEAVPMHSRWWWQTLIWCNDSRQKFVVQNFLSDW